MQRERLLDALTEVVGRDGWNATHVTDICAEAGVSTRGFYQVFASKSECFLAAFERGAWAVFRYGASVYREERPPWEHRIRSTLTAILSVLAANPSFARLCLVEMHMVGREASERLAEIVHAYAKELGRHEERCSRRRRQMVGSARVWESTLSGSILRPLAECARAGRLAEMPALAPALTFHVVLPIVGPNRAQRELACTDHDVL